MDREVAWYLASPRKRPPRLYASDTGLCAPRVWVVGAGRWVNGALRAGRRASHLRVSLSLETPRGAEGRERHPPRPTPDTNAPRQPEATPPHTSRRTRAALTSKGGSAGGSAPHRCEQQRARTDGGDAATEHVADRQGRAGERQRARDGRGRRRTAFRWCTGRRLAARYGRRDVAGRRGWRWRWKRRRSRGRGRGRRGGGRLAGRRLAERDRRGNRYCLRQVRHHDDASEVAAVDAPPAVGADAARVHGVRRLRGVVRDGDEDRLCAEGLGAVAVGGRRCGAGQRRSAAVGVAALHDGDETGDAELRSGDGDLVAVAEPARRLNGEARACRSGRADGEDAAEQQGGRSAGCDDGATNGVHGVSSIRLGRTRRLWRSAVGASSAGDRTADMRRVGLIYQPDFE